MSNFKELYEKVQVYNGKEGCFCESTSVNQDMQKMGKETKQLITLCKTGFKKAIVVGNLDKAETYIDTLEEQPPTIDAVIKKLKTIKFLDARSKVFDVTDVRGNLSDVTGIAADAAIAASAINIAHTAASWNKGLSKKLPADKVAAMSTGIAVGKHIATNTKTATIAYLSAIKKLCEKTIARMKAQLEVAKKKEQA